MKKCPKCKKNIPDNARTCPECKHRLPPKKKSPGLLALIMFKECEYCARQIPMNGPSRELECPFCHRTQEVNLDDLASAIAATSEGYQIGAGPGEEFRILRIIKPYVRCPECDHPVGVLQQFNGNKKKQKITCPECGTEISCTTPPACFNQVLPAVEWMVNTEPVIRKEKPRALVFTCLSCGAALKLKPDTERLITCEYCRNRMYLSDDAWRLLHGVAVSRSWGMIFPGRKLVPKKLPPVKKPPDPVAKNPKYGWLTLELQYPCPSCGDPVILNGPARAYRCQTCGHLLHLRPDGMAEMLADASEGTMSMFSGYDFTPYKDRLGPRCPVCNQSGPYKGNLNDIDNDRVVVCSGCGHELVHFPVPRWLGRYLPGAGRLFNACTEQELAGYRTAVDAAPMNFLLSCPACGAGNSITTDGDTPRTVSCAFCGSAIMIPPDIWSRYHPVAVFVPWTITSKRRKLEFRQKTFVRFREWLKWELRWKFGDWWDHIKEKLRKLHPGKVTMMQVTVLIKCKSCGREIPVNGPVLDFVCSRCMKAGKLTPYRFAEDLADATVQLEGNTCINPSSGYSIEANKMKTQPCRRCGAPLTIPKKKLSAGNTVEVACRKCGTVYRGGPPPRWMRESLPAAVAVFPFDGQDTMTGDPAEAIEERGETVSSLNCPVCSANITVDSLTGRSVKCRNCRNEIFIPEELWCKLHPSISVQPWVLLFRNKPEAVGDARKPENQVFI